MFALLFSLFIEEPPKPSFQYESPIIIEQYIPEPLPEPPPAPPVIVVEEVVAESDLCSCVRTARKYSPFNIPYKDAVDIQPQGTPVIGGLILLEYTNVSHVAVIMSFEEDGFKIYEGNYIPCQFSERIIKYNSSFIRGFWSE